MVESVSLILLSFASIVLAWIDLRRGLIPDWLNLTIGFAGLARVATRDGSDAVLVAGFEGIMISATIWVLRRLYFGWRGYHGVGLGDVKLLAASAIWIGIAGIPMQLLVASLTALATAGMLRLAGHDVTRQTSLPFGPFLLVGLLAALALQEMPVGY